MKNIILLLSMCLIAKLSFAKTVHPTIDDDLGFKMESHTSPKGKRGVANLKQPSVSGHDQKIQNESRDDDETEDVTKSIDGTKQERELASEEEVFDTVNDNGIMYWKY